MTDEMTLAMGIAQAVAVWHLGVALYLVSFAEKKTPFLMAVAFVKALLGSCVYLIVLEPDWAFLAAVNGLLLPLTLVLLGVISMLFTWLLWQLYELENPMGRLFGAFLTWIVKTRNTIRKFTR